MAYDEGLAERLRDVLRDRDGVDEKKMFGGLCFLSRDYMFMGVEKDRLMARVGPDAYEDSLARPHVREMDFTGRPLRGYVYVDPKGFENDADLAEWVEQCLEFIETLPPKKPKKKKAKKKRS